MHRPSVTARRINSDRHKHLSAGNLAHYFNSALGTGLVAVYGAGLLATAARLVRQRDGIDYALIVWALLMGGFYTYFNPQEAILYAGQVGFAHRGPHGERSCPQHSMMNRSQPVPTHATQILNDAVNVQETLRGGG